MMTLRSASSATRWADYPVQWRRGCEWEIVSLLRGHLAPGMQVLARENQDPARICRIGFCAGSATPARVRLDLAGAQSEGKGGALARRSSRPGAASATAPGGRRDR